MSEVVVSSKGWVVIPAGFREKYHLQAGDSVSIVDYGGVLAIVPQMTEPIRKAAGLLKGKSSLVRALLKERKRERKRESR